MAGMSSILNPVLNPLLTLNSFWVILIVSVIVSIITTLIYKYTTDQKKLKELKKETKSCQEKLKLNASNPEKSLKIQGDMMKLNVEYMKSSFKPMFFTIIPVLLFFGWLGANLAFIPLQPETPFSINVTVLENVQAEISLILPSELSMDDEETKTAQINLGWQGIKGPVGQYDLILKNEETQEEQIISVLITEEQKYLDPLKELNSPTFKKVVVNHQKLLPFKGIVVFENIFWIGNFGWLGTYILFSLIFSTLLRKLLKIA
jgi:uncharacterized membrane protein (DUF106 family)